jgi:predicted TIM-barrel fold metal-dependent hydrolase
MEGEFKVSTDKKEKLKLESRIISANWESTIARGGAEADLRVKTAFVAEGSPIEIKGISSEGKAPETIKGKVYNNVFTGKMLIPEKVKLGAEIWFEAKLPKHGLKMEAGASIPAKPGITVKKMNWDKKEIQRGEEVHLTCQFDSGVMDGEDAEILIFEYNPNSYDFKILSFHKTVMNNQVDATWLFEYIEDSAKIATHTELNSVGKKYAVPQFYFVIDIDGVRIGKNRECGLLGFKDFIDVIVKRGNQNKEKVKYKLIFADGTTKLIAADSKSSIKLEDVPPGSFSIVPEDLTDELAIQGKSGCGLIAIFPDFNLLIDAHMHIQSNNCCPMPLQWAIIATNAGWLKGRPADASRKEMNDTAAGVIGGIFAGRLGDIGRLSTDMISKLYSEKLADEDMKTEMCWTILDEKKMAKFKENEKEKMRLVAGKKARLSKLSQKSISGYDDEFLQNTAYYFEGNRIQRMCVALLMDMSYSHYWGRCGLPIYLSTNTNMFYINSFVAASVKRRADSRNIYVSLKNSVITPKIKIIFNMEQPSPTFDQSSIIHFFPSFSGKEITSQNSTSFYRDQYTLLQSGDSNIDFKIPIIRFEQNDKVKALLSRKYIHFIESAPEEDKSKFEDYDLQKEFSIVAMIQNPLSLFAFYHFDPRRHGLSEKKSVETVAQEILSEHAFFTYKENTKFHYSKGNVTVNGCVDATMDQNFNDESILKNMLKDHLRTCEDALHALHLIAPDNGNVFWGVKMYPRLGFSPSDFTNYPWFSDFYSSCEKKGIPITSHCGPGGMSIADYHLYERYDEKRFLDNSEKKREYDLKHAAKRFDGVLDGTTGQDSPARWQEVLTKFPNLKLNLAHFGSSDTWKSAAGFKAADEELVKRVHGNAKEYDEISKYRDWTKKIAELVQKYDNVYTDISYFVNDDPSWFFGAGYDRDNVAEDLIYLLKKYPSLKDRLLMGSDWYMIEKDKEKGIGDYFRKMFYMLRGISKEVNYDAWHQFSVVNPLRFLGLVDDKKGSAGPFSIDTSKLEKLLPKFKQKMESTEWVKKTSFKGEYELVKSKFDSSINYLNKLKILSSEKIITNGKLTILNF